MEAQCARQGSRGASIERQRPSAHAGQRVVSAACIPTLVWRLPHLGHIGRGGGDCAFELADVSTEGLLGCRKLLWVVVALAVGANDALLEVGRQKQRHGSLFDVKGLCVVP